MIGLNGEEFHILEKFSVQSSDNALGVDKGGVGDQGNMYGYAEKGTKELTPLLIVLSRKLARRVNELIKEFSTILSIFFGVDGKCQVSVDFDKDVPKKETTVIVSIQTKPVIPRRLNGPLVLFCVHEVIPKRLVTNDTIVLINPTVDFVKGGSYLDSGLSGCKLQYDSYGGFALHGGGAWSEKVSQKQIEAQVTMLGISQKTLLQLI
ncbi:MAG: methionine adenosyltransferase domain-containing protein [Firmicutes bacterium]|nr:methionine adenosyltransferase domain-containing protein [Bacillota bacterium]